MLLLLVVGIILALSVRAFDQREIEYRPRPSDYEELNSPTPQENTTEPPEEDTQGLFLGENTVLNYRSTLINATGSAAQENG